MESDISLWKHNHIIFYLPCTHCQGTKDLGYFSWSELFWKLFSAFHLSGISISSAALVRKGQITLQSLPPFGHLGLPLVKCSAGATECEAAGLVPNLCQHVPGMPYCMLLFDGCTNKRGADRNLHHHQGEGTGDAKWYWLRHFHANQTRAQLYSFGQCLWWSWKIKYCILYCSKYFSELHRVSKGT